MSSSKSSGAKPPSSPVRTCILVNGMHRSGTSMMTGILNRLGCDIAKNLMPANFANETGYYESTPISYLNDTILKTAGLSWDSWKEIDAGWFDTPEAAAFHDEAVAVLKQEFGTSRLFALKDPRISRLLPFWRKVFETLELRVISLHICRNPRNVAASLQARDGLSLAYGQLLWLRNVLEAEAQTRDLPRLFTRYEDVLSDWTSMIQALSAKMDITWPQAQATATEEIRSFVNPDLMHFSGDPDKSEKPSDIVDLATRTYATFCKWTEKGETEKDRDSLDALLKKLNRLLLPFADHLDAELATTKSLLLSRTAFGRLEAQVAEAQIKTDHWKAKTAALEEEVETLKLEQQAQQIRYDHAMQKAQAERNALQAEMDNKIENARKAAEARTVRLVRADTKALDTLRGTLVLKMTELERKAHELDEKTHELNRQHAETNHLRQTLDEALFAVDSLKNSTSWRLTAPLRKLKSSMDR